MALDVNNMTIFRPPEHEVDPELKAKLDSMKDLREYTVEVYIPPGAKLSGFIPSNVPNKGYMKVHALSYEAAERAIMSKLNRIR